VTYKLSAVAIFDSTLGLKFFFMIKFRENRLQFITYNACRPTDKRRCFGESPFLDSLSFFDESANLASYNNLGESHVTGESSFLSRIV